MIFLPLVVMQYSLKSGTLEWGQQFEARRLPGMVSLCNEYVPLQNGREIDEVIIDHILQITRRIL